jgi:hypothetical protein
MKIKNLNKYRTDAVKKYQAALERLAAVRDDSAFTKAPITPGDLVMREPLNRKSKMHPSWDSPFIVLGSTEMDVYKLGTANRYVLGNTVNAKHLYYGS